MPARALVFSRSAGCGARRGSWIGLLVVALLSAAASAWGAVPPAAGGDEEELIFEEEGEEDGGAALEDDEGGDELVLEGEGGAPAAPARRTFVPTGLLWGSFRQELREDLRHEPGEYVFEIFARYDLGASVQLTPTVRGDISGRLYLRYLEAANPDGPDLPFFGDRSRWDAEPELRDAVISYAAGPISLRVGNQVVSWGRTDFARPLDVLNPYDYRDGISGSSEAPVLPVFMARLDWRISPEVALQLVYAPFFEPHRFYVFGNDNAPIRFLRGTPLSRSIDLLTDALDPTLWDEAQPLLQATEKPSNPITDAQLGFAVDLRLGAVDLSLHYAYVYDRYPAFDFDEDLALVLDATLQAGFDPLALAKRFADPAVREAVDRIRARDAQITDLARGRYLRSHVAGLSLGTTLGDFGLKVDAAFFDQRVLYTEDFAPYTAPVVATAAGLDYVSGTDFDAVLEMSGIFVLDGEDAPDLMIVRRPWVHTFAFARWRLLSDESLQLGLGGMLGWNELDWLLLAEVRYRFGPHHALAGGVQIYEGDSSSVGGLYDRNDFGFLRWEWFL